MFNFILKTALISTLALSATANARSIDIFSGRLVEIAKCELQKSTKDKECVKLQLPQDVSCEVELKNPNQRHQEAVIRLAGFNHDQRIRQGGLLMQKQFERHSLFRMKNGKEEIHLVSRRSDLTAPYEVTEVNYNQNIQSTEDTLSWLQSTCQF